MGHRLERNLVTLVQFPGTFNGRKELRHEWNAGFELIHSTDVVLRGNVVAGSERAGYHVDGEPCDGPSRLADNTVHACLIGVMLLPKDGQPVCTLVANYAVWRAFDYGVYFQVVSSVVVSGLTSIDNMLGVFPMVIGPSASSHAHADKFARIEGSTFVGSSSSFDCG